jgi:shikimate dehydrogenase
VSRCRAAVLGRPVGHSLSPVIHNAGFRAAGLTGWSYGAHEVDEAGLPGFVAGLGPGWAGLSLTMPLKHVALTLADEITDTARLLGAANTLVRLDPPPGSKERGSAAGGARWRADNTDAPGLVDALRGAGVETAKRVALLGAGGTARAAVWAAARLGAAELVVYARRAEAVEGLREVADRVGLPLVAAGWADAAGCADRADVVVSTVPAGVADEVAGQVGWHGGVTVFDVLYHPWPTRLAAAATAGGATVVGGLELLLAQAVHQFEQFTGVPAPVPAMRAALHDAATARFDS